MLITNYAPTPNPSQGGDFRATPFSGGVGGGLASIEEKDLPIKLFKEIKK
jgi:hypothetical protein